MNDLEPVSPSRARVALNARVSPELRRRLHAVSRKRSSSIQDVVEAQLTALLDGIDVAGLKAGTGPMPGTATNARGAQTVALNVRVRPQLAQRIEALVAVCEGTTRQGLIIEALEALEEPGETPEELWALVAGTDVPKSSKQPSKQASKQTGRAARADAPAKKAPAKKAAAKKAASKKASKGPAEASSDAQAAPAKPRRPLTAVGMLG